MSIPGSANALLLASTAAAAGGYQIERSLRFNSSDSAFCSRTPAVAGNRTTFTWAGWVKRSTISDSVPVHIFSAGTSGASNVDFFGIETDNTIRFGSYNGSAFVFQYVTTQVFRDPSAWYHLVLAVDTTIASPSSDRVKFYVNGVRVTTFSTATDPGPSAQCAHFNTTSTHYLGKFIDIARYFPGYLADVHFIDGQALTPSSFTEVSATTGQLLPKAYSGSYGTNGFYLQFADNSSNTATTLGKDTSGNSNNWTPNNFVVSLGTQYSGASRFTFNAGTTGWYNSAPHDLFDGSLSTALSATNGNQPGAGYTWDATGLGLSGTLRVYTYGDGGNGTTVTVNGTTSLFTSSIQWLDFGNVGAINTIKCSRLDQGVLYAIEVNGTQLVENLSSDIDSLVDTPTSYGTPDTGVGGEIRGNYATLNPLLIISTTILSNGNLESIDTGSDAISLSTIGVSSGKWYWEITGLDITGTTSNQRSVIGIVKNPQLFALSTYVGSNANGFGYYSGNGQKLTSGTGSSYGATWATSNVMGVALDLDNGTLVFYKNNTSQGTAFTGLNTGDTYFPAASQAGSGKVAFNFGQRAFAYTAPSGFKALCDTNLPAPLTAKPNELMDAVIYTGSSGSQSITTNFSPDLVWIKTRNATTSHEIYDIVRGAGVRLSSNDTGADNNLGANGLSSFNNNGFTVPSTANYGINGSGYTYVGWAWDAGTSTVSNTDGSITSQVRANASAGFSVVTYTAGASNATVGHGLGVAPSFIIVKSRTTTANWVVYHSALGKDGYLHLDLTNAFASNSNYWGTATPNSTVFGLANSGFANNNGNMVAYAFSPVSGYSSFGSYVGNGSSDGVFVYTGFRPRWVMIKGSSFGGESWFIWDTSRNTYNQMGARLLANEPLAENSDQVFGDILSNGFKLRNTWGGINGSSNTYIYAAFAENPFQYARAR